MMKDNFTSKWTKTDANGLTATGSVAYISYSKKTAANLCVGCASRSGCCSIVTWTQTSLITQAGKKFVNFISQDSQTRKYAKLSATQPEFLTFELSIRSRSYHRHNALLSWSTHYHTKRHDLKCTSLAENVSVSKRNSVCWRADFAQNLFERIVFDTHTHTSRFYT